MFEGWKEKLEYKLEKADEEGDADGKYSLIAQVELGLTALKLMDIADPNQLWVWLSGYNFPEYKQLNTEQRRALGNARLFLKFGRYAWLDHLKEYMALPARWRRFNVTEYDFNESDEMTRVVDRDVFYSAALHNPPALQVKSRLLPKTEIPVHFVHSGSGDDISVNIDGDLAAFAKKQDVLSPRLPDSPTLQREPIHISFADLHLYAGELNQRFGINCHDSSGAPDLTSGGNPAGGIHPKYIRDWMKAMVDIVQFKTVTRAGDGQVQFGAINQGELVINGVTHVAGMVGAGKSTLAEIVAMYGVDKGSFRTTLIVGDAQTALDLADKLNHVLQAGSDKPIAVPLIGKTTRGVHYQKLRRALAQPGSHWGETWLNPTCLLQGLIPPETIGTPLPQGSEPCERLEQKRRDTNATNSACECPFFSVCPSRALDRQIPEARIWVTTPQAMMQSRLPIQVDQRRFRFAELIYFYSDLVIFDEIDADQQVVDDIFAPERHLIKARGGDLGDADDYSSGWFGLSPKNQTYERRRRALTFSGVAADHLCSMLEAEKYKFLKDWTDNFGYFSPAILFRSLVDEIEKMKGIPPEVPTTKASAILDNHPIMDEFSRFQDMDKLFLDSLTASPGMHLLSNVLMHAFMGVSHSNGPQPDALTWVKTELGDAPISESSDVKVSRLALKLEFAVVLSALEYYLYELSHGYQDADEDDETNPPSFQHSSNIPAEFLSAIPSSPLGSASGFRYTSNDAKHKGAAPGRKSRHLMYFQFAGLGRSVLLNFSNLFTDSGYPGPNVLCMSGTSWMEDSDEHHFAVDPTGVLEAPLPSQDAIRHSQFVFAPQRDRANNNLIRVSGSGNLELELVKMSVSLALSPKVDQSLLVLVMNRLGTLGQQDPKWRDRQRILILVNSYKQAKLVAQTIHDQIYLDRPDWDIYYLERAATDGDIEDQWASTGNGTKSLQRPDLIHFGKMTSNPTILVAPLLSVGRRHNILNQDNSAAFGAVFFATRPMKNPDDLSKWVSWVNHQTVRMLQDPYGKNWKGANTPGDRLSRIRRVMNSWWGRIGSYQGASSINDRLLRRSLSASMAAIIVQATGRLLRNGVPFLAYFIDAAWAPRSAELAPDSSKTSMLIEMIDIVNEYCHTPIGNALFGPLNEALQNITGIIRQLPTEANSGTPTHNDDTEPDGYDGDSVDY